MTIKQLHTVAYEIAKLTLSISYRKHVGHVGSALSISDILSVLYFDTLRLDPEYLSDPFRDRFILSKGHAAAALYAALFKKGILTKKAFESFAEDGGLCEHPMIETPGVEMTSGSLGHGLGFAAGIAWGLKKLGREKSLHFTGSPHNNGKSPHVFVLISDGECGEGSVWEAALFASRMKLDNVTVILDDNGWQCFGETEKITHLSPQSDKWNAFGFGVRELDGHNISDLKQSFSRLPVEKGKPSMLIAHTLTGHGITSIENKLDGHYKVFTEQEYSVALKDLAERYAA